MKLRSVLRFNGTLGVTLPSEYSKELGLHWKDQVEMYFVGPDKIVIKRLKVQKDPTIATA